MLKKYTIYDIETDCPIKVTKQQLKQYKQMWKLAAPKINNVKGKILLFGSAGQMETTKELKNIFYTNEQH